MGGDPMGRARARALVVLVLMLGLGLSMGCARREQQPESDVLLGGLTPQTLLQRLPSWKEAFEAYRPDSAAVEVVRRVNRPVEVLVFLGTWCPDSEREVPRFLKTLAVADNVKVRAKYYGVPRGFREKDDTAARYDIVAVPTFIVRVGGREIGRIVEQAEAGIERNLAAILMQAGMVGVGK